jgi:small subunit ribosomal protein S17
MSNEQSNITARRHSETGVVSSAKGDKTIHVVITRLVKHPMYGKYMRRRSKLAVHDPANEAHVGDTVEVTGCRPISKSKSWRLVRVVKRPALEATQQ